MSLNKVFDLSAYISTGIIKLITLKWMMTKSKGQSMQSLC